MKKSVYSLVLMDDVVNAIDELAYSLHTSRSNLINQILAERVALITPEQHLQRIFESLSDYLKPYTYFQIQNQAADHMYSVKSALRYKYNPTIRYCVYLRQQDGRLTGQLRIISRTQSDVLYYYLNEFFEIWAQIENEILPANWESEEGSKWLRVLRLEHFQKSSQGVEIAGALSHYIKGLDDGLKIFFGELENNLLQRTLLKEHYKNHYQEVTYLI